MGNESGAEDPFVIKKNRMIAMGQVFDKNSLIFPHLSFALINYIF
jgi:hypothetical protein